VWDVGRDRRTHAAGSDASSILSPPILGCVSSGVSMLAVGGVVAEVRNGKNTAKKGGPTHSEGTASKGNTSGGAATGTRTAVRETREDTTGQDMERN